MSDQSSQNLQEKRPKKLLDQVSRVSWFQHLSAHVKKLQHLEKLFQSVVDSELAHECKVLELHGGCLWLEVQHAAWATRIRYSTPHLIQTLRQYSEFYELSSIHCTVRPASLNSRSQSRPSSISEDTALSLINTANTIEDPLLKSALLKLAGGGDVPTLCPL